MANKLIFKDAEAARDAIMVSQKKEIEGLYNKWADEIGERAKFYSHKSTASAPVSERYYRELQKQLRATSQEISNEIHSKIKANMYTISDAVVADNIKWLESFGFSKDGLNAAFSYVPDNVVRNLITGQVYDSGWSLSARIWGDNEQTLKDIYQVMAKGMAENKPIYEIAKDLEKYVRPSAQLPWNLRMSDGKKIFKKQVDYNAQRLARTLAQHSYQQSFIATTQKNPFILEYIWHSNGSRVCPICLDRDGATFKKDALPMDHPNGMCIMEPVVAENMVDQLADWFNSPDGTYPEIDAFAGNFGYNASSSNVKTAQDFINKYGMSTKSPSAWFNSLTPTQKAEAKLLKEQSGMTWNQWYEKNVYDTGDATENFIKKYGTSDKSPNAWFNSLSAAQKAEAKALKEQSGLTWNQWYEKNIYSGTNTKTVKAFNDVQDKYLSPYGFSPSNMPKNFDDWSYKVSDAQKTEILKSMGTGWSDPHPYQQLMKYFNDNLADSSKFVDKAADVTKAAKATTKKATTSKTSTKFSSTEWYESIRKNDLSKMENWTDDWVKALTSSEKDAIRTYTGAAYRDINGYLRGMRSSTGYADEIKACKAALSKASLPEEVIVRRGSDYNMLRDLGFYKITSETKNQVIGGIVTDKGFVSTSPASSGGFSGSIEYVIKIPAGSQAMYVDTISKYQGEQELLINCGGKNIIEDVEFDGFGYVKKIYMTLKNLK